LKDLTLTKTNGNAFLYGDVHQGFYDMLFPDYSTHVTHSPYGSILQTVRSVAKELYTSTRKTVNVYVTGHSLGSAIATVFYARAVKSPEDFGPNIKLCNAYLYGTPRIGDVDFCAGYYSAVNKPFGNTQMLYRVVNNVDIVCRVPLGVGDDIASRDYLLKKSIFNYGHVGEEVLITGAEKPLFTGNSFAPGTEVRIVQDDNHYGLDHENGNNHPPHRQSPNEPVDFSLKNLSSFSLSNIKKWNQKIHSDNPFTIIEWFLPALIGDHAPSSYMHSLEKLKPERPVQHG